MRNDELFSDGWMPMKMFSPQPCETFEVRLADGAELRSFWTGRIWLYQGKAIGPVAWRSVAVCAA